MPTPPTVVLYGLEATGKSTCIKAVLDALDIPHALIDSRGCITTRHLLERTVAECKAAVRKFHDGDDDAATVVDDIDNRCESVSVLVARLQTLLEHSQQRKFILVFDGVDKQREAPPTLLPAIARLGEMVRHFPSPIHSTKTDTKIFLRSPFCPPSSSSLPRAQATSTTRASRTSTSPPTRSPTS